MLDPFLLEAAFITAPPLTAVSHLEFARTLKVPDGPLAGERFDPASEPAQQVIMDALDGKILDAQGKPYRDIVYCAATQTGKTIVGVIVPTMRAVAALGQNTIYCLPTGDLISKVWTTKLEPALRGCGLGDWLPVKGPGSRGGRAPALPLINPTTKQRAGSIIFMAGGEGSKREAGQAGVTAGVVVIDEADEYESTHRISLIRQRAASFGKDALTLAASTVKKDENSVILGLLAESTDSRLWFACPFCHRYQPLEWTHVRYDATDDLTAHDSSRYYCGHCGTGWTEQERHTALSHWKLVNRGGSVTEGGEVVGEAPRTRTFGLRCGKLDYHLGYGLGELATEHRRAKARIDASGDHGLMRSFYRDRLSLEYTGDRVAEDGVPHQLTKGYLVARSSASSYGPEKRSEQSPNDSVHIADCPAEVEALSVACDVQRGSKEAPGRLYFLLTGLKADFSTFDLAWGSLALAPIGHYPEEPQLHAGLDRLHQLMNGCAQDYARPIVRRGVDVGDRQDEIRRWLVRHPEWWAIKGSASTLRVGDRWDLADWIYRREQEGRWNLHLVDVSCVRRQAQMQFLVAPGKPGSAMVPRGLALSDSLPRHYCATCEIPDGRGGVRWSNKEPDRKFHPEWARRHDLLDCRTYNLAMIYQWVRESDRKRSSKDYEDQLAKQQAQAPTTGAGWVDQFTGGDGTWNL